MIGLFIGLFFLIAFGIYEFEINKYSRKKIPNVIHVNGTRGKSSVTRLIAAGLRAGGKRTLAKTTGSAPALIFESGSEKPIIRHHGANIKEQIKIMKFAAHRKPEFLVLECMAVTPEYQWVTEHEMVKSNIGVITNSRLDHLDVMGPGLRNVTLSLCNTIPSHGKLFTSEKKMLPLLKKQAKRRHTEIFQAQDIDISNQEMKKFPYIEHKENVTLALSICQHFNIPKNIALQGMYQVQPDVGAMEIYDCERQNKKFYFVHAFAANDPESTEFVIDSVKKLYPHIESVVLVLSTRADRMFRSKQLIQMMKNIDFTHLYLIGEQTTSILLFARKHKLDQEKITDCGWINGDELVQKIVKLDSEETLILGIGNIGGNGGQIVNYFKARDRKRKK